MEEKWVIAAKKADFNGIAARFGIDPVIARIMVNRGLTDPEEMEIYLYGGRENLHDPHLLRDADKAAEILEADIRAGRRVRVIGDYDVDGIMATYILIKALARVGAEADYALPDRVTDGYGLNERMIREAAADGIDTILTCDNGISAAGPVRLAKDLGLTVIVTDHHEIPPEGIPAADAVVNPKRRDCAYPFEGLCGAAVAFKLAQVLYEREGVPAEEADTLIEYAGFATVVDVMDLIGENRILVKLAIEMLRHTTNTGLLALIREKNVRQDRIGAYQIGFVLGPCLNASGRLQTAQLSLELLLCEGETKAAALASELSHINEARKEMTQEALADALSVIERQGYERDRVLVLFLPECHESLAGLVAGKVREIYNRPVFVVTRGQDACKGSGRSIPAYSMYEEMTRCADLFLQFGGHPMAAGFSLREENLDALRQRLNEQTTLTEEDLVPKVVLDADMPIGYITMDLIRQLDLLEPFGKGNAKPVFADRNLRITSLRTLGKEGNVIRMRLLGSDGTAMDAVYFGDVENLRLSLEQKYDILTAEDTICGKCASQPALHFKYYPEIDDFQNQLKIQLKITGFQA